MNATPLEMLGPLGLGDAVAEVAGRLERAGQMDPDARAQLERVEQKLDWLIGAVLTVADRHGHRLGLDPPRLIRSLPPSLGEIRAASAAQAAQDRRDGPTPGTDTPDSATGLTAPDRTG